MFTLPPRPPKDYVIKSVPPTQLSGDAFTPLAPPRVTQPSFGVFCSPIEYNDNELPEKKIESINPSVLDRWVARDRAFWVDDPGKDAYFLHQTYNKYSVVVEESYDPRFKPKEHVFNRSFKYELDCLEDMRLQKLRNKCRREQMEKEEKLKLLERVEKAKEKPPFKIEPCKAEAPFWWKKPTEGNKELALSSFTIKNGEIVPKPATSTYRKSFVRWQEEPNLLEYKQIDACQRRNEMLLVGQPFRSEACNWYYENYPPPDIKFIPQKFGQ